ncbi:A24 family peptidase [Blastochloris viridis]|uniref:Type IV prepilin peptidase TadV/CpaA n=1 Tax=Blastochloris viridis TaxID=1079 RepID=A0A182D444_BLAVI|nr:prepilin peptidase [Blastochloris viridis]ALK10527.1 Type IV leader peptidase family protein [Blastochloris viridis]BAR99522.1 type IV prepilin peptidase TadV/CpaA [Blastochloris viridis]
MLVTLVVLSVFPMAMAFAAASDLITMRISNRVSAVLVVGFVVAAVLTGLPLAEVGWHVAAAALVLAVTFGFFAAGWMGGGDAKLASATALWLGWGSLLEYALIASALGGALTLILLSVRTVPLPAALLRQDWVLRLHHTKAGVPYGIALAAAGLLIYPQTTWMAAIAPG